MAAMKNAAKTSPGREPSSRGIPMNRNKVLAYIGWRTKA
jgi:hypothetical protein